MDNTFTVVEKDAIDSPVKDIDWTGQEISSEEVQLADSGKGKKIFIRQFEFRLPNGTEKPSDEELLSVHRSKILAFLWKDELVSAGIMKVAWDTTDEKKFFIFVLAEAKSGSVILEQPKILTHDI